MGYDLGKLVVLSIVLIVAVVTTSLAASGVQAQPSLVIYSVNLVPVLPGFKFAYVISGTGFGTGPTTVAPNGPWTGVDTVVGGSKPGLGFCDVNQGWNAGGDYLVGVPVCSFGGYNNIGVFLTYWSNTRIVISGYGNALPADGYHIYHGDTLIFAVFAPHNAAQTFYTISYTGPNV